MFLDRGENLREPIPKPDHSNCGQDEEDKLKLGDTVQVHPASLSNGGLQDSELIRLTEDIPEVGYHDDEGRLILPMDEYEL